MISPRHGVEWIVIDQQTAQPTFIEYFNLDPSSTSAHSPHCLWMLTLLRTAFSQSSCPRFAFGDKWRVPNRRRPRHAHPVSILASQTLYSRF
jgi:hypothetical protein